MILPPGTIPNDNQRHDYCIRCLRETLVSVILKGQQHYQCTACRHLGPRALIIDPTIKWWTDKNGEYCHETSGIFMHNTRGEFLFFKRMTHPFGLAVPAGHVDQGEQPIIAAQRELREETGVSLPISALKFIASNDIPGDMCRRGADMHRWNIYVCAMPPLTNIKVDPRESSQPVWLTLGAALHRSNVLPTHAMRMIITQYGKKIWSAVR